ncbi:MAG: vitamin K epoxide reductase family protein [Acidimicrobiales bacterium]
MSRTRLAAAAGTVPPVQAQEPAPGLARWLPLTATGIAVLGIADGVYLTVAHFTTAAILACSGTGFVNCAKVTTSAQSEIVGIPVAVLGLAYFVAMTVLNLPQCWRAEGDLGAWLARLRLAGAVAGIGFVVYLVYTELLVIGSICIFCTIIHVLAFVLFVLVVVGSTQRGLGRAARPCGDA